MNVTYTTRFRGVPPKLKAALDRMFRDEVDRFPSRLSMDGASVDANKDKRRAKS